MTAETFFKHPYLIICSFFLYITYMTRYLNASFSGPQDFMLFELNFFPFYITSSFVCVLLWLPSVFRSKPGQKAKKTVMNRIRFLARRFCSGFFYAFGLCYLLWGLILTKFFTDNYVKILKTGISWLQVNLLFILVLSVLFLSIYYRPKKVRILPFLGIILFLIGITLLLFNVREINQLFPNAILYLSNLDTLVQAFANRLLGLLLFGVFWLFAAKINLSDSDYFKDSSTLWFSTLCFSCFVYILFLLFAGKMGDFVSIYLERRISLEETVSTVLFGLFQWFCLKAFCFFEAQKKSGNAPVFLKGWLVSVLAFMTVMPFCDKQNAAFLLKIFFIVLGVYCFWKPEPLQFSEVKLKAGKQFIVLLLLSLLLTGIGLWTLYQSVMGGLGIPKMILKVNLFLLISFLKEHARAVICVTAFLLSVYLYKNDSFEKSTAVLLSGLFAVIFSFLAVNLLQEYFFVIFIKPLDSLPKSYLWLQSILKAKLLWIRQIEIVLGLALLLLTFVQGIRKGARLVLWTVLSNLMLYIALSKVLFNGCGIVSGYTVALIRNSLALGTEVLLEKLGFYYLIEEIVTHGIPLLVLFFSVIIYYNKNLEERILPAVLYCRQPRAAEWEKIEKSLAVLQEKNVLSDTGSIQILISRITERNAYAIGNKTVAVMEPLFQTLSPLQMAGVLSHELGHIEHKDSRLRILLYVLNLPTTLLKKFFLYLTFQRSMMIAAGCFFGLCVLMFRHVLEMLYPHINYIFTWFLLQTAIFLMENQDMQDSEWQADAFAASHGLGRELKEALLQMTVAEETEAEKEALMENYPDMAERIRRLETLQNPIGA